MKAESHRGGEGGELNSGSYYTERLCFAAK